MCVPLRSPRETNGAPALLILRNASSVSAPPAIPAGIRFRADDDEVVVHDGIAPHAVALAQELFLGRLRMHEHDVGIAAAREVERLARAERHDAHLDPGPLLEDRQEVLEEPRLLGRGRRCDRDEPLRERARRAGERERAEQRFARARPQLHGSSPLMNAAASAVDGCAKKRSTGA